MARETPPLLKYCGQGPSSRVPPQIVFVQVRKCSMLPSRFSRLSSSPQTLKDSICPPSSPRILKVISRLQDAQHYHDVRLGWRRRRAACEAQGRLGNHNCMPSKSHSVERFCDEGTRVHCACRGAGMRWGRVDCWVSRGSRFHLGTYH
ncbi:hypothetical protein C8R45DRAFT_1217341 [Mycena sanguinolenta]|nr:hypothetical protein C8R45DRAFT_1217341 [Mycena sanguinolenta]